jgi:predicted nuclease of predicted toxin-antitoxin system
MTNFSFYSNENFALDMVKMLRELGHTVITSYEAGQANRKISDDEVLNYATRNNLAVITFNRDDFIELHNNIIQHSGIIICKTDRDYQDQINFLDEYLQNQESLINRLIRIKKQQKKGSRQHIFVTQEYFK